VAQHDRPAVYDAFDKYEKARRGADASDLCDFVRHLHRRVVAGKVRVVDGDVSGGAGCRPTHIFIDEVQDFTPAELELVLAYAGDARVTVAGDTAQTITRGTTSFKFAAVSAAFHLAGRNVAPVETLTTNWRSHGGVQALCSHVVRAMCRRFPGAVDKLPEERAHFAGPLPTCLPATDLVAAADVLFTGEVGRCRLNPGEPSNRFAKP
jgi:superfamily I DNA/RNA helicase